MELALTIVSIVLALGAIGAWLLSAGKRMAEQDQNKKDIGSVSRKVEHVRRELREEIGDVRSEHRQLDTKVDELVKTTAANNTLLSVINGTLNRLLDTHIGEPK